ncbi:hypothetical protein GCM10023238_37960 [Streptomyces heliomycini]
MRVCDFAVAVGYGEDLVYKIETGKRIPRPEYLDTADEVLGAGGLIAAMKEDVKKVRYPKKVRDLTQMEGRAVEIGLYEPSSVAGLLQDAGTRASSVRCLATALFGGTTWSACWLPGWPDNPSSIGARTVTQLRPRRGGASTPSGTQW